jgi:hypothetical protein
VPVISGTYVRKRHFDRPLRATRAWCVSSRRPRPGPPHASREPDARCPIGRWCDPISRERPAASGDHQTRQPEAERPRRSPDFGPRRRSAFSASLRRHVVRVAATRFSGSSGPARNVRLRRHEHARYQAISPGSPWVAAEPPAAFLRLSTAGAGATDLVQGIEILGQVAKALHRARRAARTS